MYNPIFNDAALPAATEKIIAETIPLTRGRTISGTIRATFGAGAPANIRLNAYYSPDGVNWDNEPIDFVTLTAVAATLRQRTDMLGVPEHGYLRLAVENLDAAIAATNIMVWYTVQSFDIPVAETLTIIAKTMHELKYILRKMGVISRGSPLTRQGEDR